jgi:hypothetical protein
MTGKTQRRKFQTLENPWGLLTVAVLLVALAVKVYGAWAYALQPSSDYGRVALMAKHMADGLPWPVFFYGSAYMGTVEPAISAALCALFGFSGFMVSLGTALAAWGLVVMIGRIGDRAGGPAAGLGALLFVVIGPFPFFYYMASPRGGYAVAMALGLWVLHRTAQLAAAEWERRPASPAAYAVLGLAAGIGWWSNPLITASLLTAAALLTVALRGRVLRLRIVAGLAGFALGTLPVWWWNARNGWLTLSMTQSIGGTSMGEGLLLFAARMRELLEGPGWGMAGLGMTVLLAAAGGVAIFAAPRRDGEAGWMRAAVAVFTLVSLALFVRSHFARVPSVRYVLPMVPVLAIAFGALFAAVARRWGPRFAWALGAVMLAVHAPALHTAWYARVADEPEWRGAAELADAAQAAGIEVLQGDIWTHWINAAADEAMPVVDLRAEPYPPYDVAAERAARIGVLNGIGGVAAFLRATGGEAAVLTSGAWRVHHAFVPPAPVVPLDVSLRGENDGGAALVDGDLYTRWSGKGYETVTLTWDAPRAVEGIVFFNLDNDLPREVAMEVRDAGGVWHWTARGSLTAWFWSGERPWFGKLYARAELRVTNRIANATALRLYAAGEQWGVGEAVVLGPVKPDEAGVGSERFVPDRIRRLFTDRSVTAFPVGPEVAVVRPAFMEKDIHTMQDTFRPDYPVVQEIQPGDAFFVGAGWVDHAAAVFAPREAQGLVRHEVPGGTIWFLPPDQLPLPGGFRWLGITAFDLPPGLRGDPAERAAADGESLAIFSPDLALTGFTVVRDEASGGWRFIWRWRVGPGLDPAHLTVFLHARAADGAQLFQDDHRLLEDVYPRLIADQPGMITYTIERVVPNTGSEPAVFHVGLVDAATGRRLVPATGHPTRRHAVVMEMP